MKSRMLTFALSLSLAASLLAGCSKSEETAAVDTESAAETSAPAETALESESESETEAPDESTTLRAAIGEVQREWNPAFAQAEGDQEIISLIYEPLLATSRSGEVLYTAGDDAKADYQGTEYDYQGISTVALHYDTDTNETTYTIRLRDGVTFSDGTPMTADDLIFTYYVLCDPSYDGGYVVDEQQILGMEAYRKNNSAAPGVTVSSEEISALLNNPTEEFKNAIIEQITRPTLEEERTWCEENWQNYVDRGYGNSAQEFFATLYTYSADASYDIEGKSMDEVLEDTINLYSMNYTQLAKNYQGDSSYFDAKVRQIAENLLYQNKVDGAGGTEVANISGIVKVDDRTISINCLGYSTQKLYNLCNIVVLPLHYYGDPDNYNYDNNQFGLTRGDLSSIREKSAAPLGAGPYQLAEDAGGEIRLTANPSYYKGAPAISNLTLVPMDESERLAAVTNGSVDLARISLNKEETATLEQTNGGSLSGDKIITELVGDNSYYYFGINASLMKVGTDSNSEQSLALRKAFATLLAFDRANLGEQYYGASAAVIDYSCTTENWAAVSRDSEGGSEAYAVKADGSPIYTEGQSTEERTAAARAAAVEYLTAAGYTYDAEAGVFTAAPEGGKMEFTALIPPYLAGENAMTIALSNLKSTLESLGFVMNIQEVTDLNEFVWYLSEHSADLWCGERATPVEPQLVSYYHSTGNSNFYGLNVPALDEILSSLAGGSALYEERIPAYHQIYTLLRDQAVEVPAYERQDGVIYNAERIDASTIQALSGYYNWTNEAATLRLK